MSRLNVVLCGFGQIGRKMALAIAESDDFELAGVIDSDRTLVGEDAGKLLGLSDGPIIVPDVFGLPGEGEADIALICTASSADKVAELVRAFLKRPLPVVTSCEVFSALAAAHPELAAELDRAAKEAGVAVLGSGINPGFLMDELPALLMKASRDIRSVRVERVQDASTRRSQFQKKIGAGLTPEEFEAAREAGTLRHVGLKESAWLLARSLGETLTDFTETIEPVEAEEALLLPNAIPVAAHQARGVRQIGHGKAGKVKIELDFLAAIGEEKSFDRITIEGTPRIESTIEGGVNGDAGTVAVLLSAMKMVSKSSKIGLLSMTDLPVVP